MKGGEPLTEKRENIMGKVHGKYEYEKRKITRGGDDFITWEYKIKNRDTWVEFKYIIEISKTALNIEPLLLPYPIPETIKSEGEYLVKRWLDNGKEERIRGLVHSKGIGVMFGVEWRQ